MVLAKSKKSVGLGNTLMNDRFGKNKGGDRKKTSAITRTNHATGEQYLVNEKQDAAWVKMRSVTEQGALDEFLATAELAGTDFTAEKMNNVKIIHTDQKNPYLLSANEERAVVGKQRAHRGRLTVPRRPKWDSSTTPQELDALERESFLHWRRGLADLEENHDLLMTPFERNLEVWRQLWRVIERSDLIVQIVDARNPLMFRSEDLDLCVKEVDPKKENLLLINKADMMTVAQRKAWAKHLKKAGIAYKFFSAQLAKEQNEARDQDSESEDEVPQPTSSRRAQKQPVTEDDSEEESEEEGGVETADDDDIQILTVQELEGIFLQHSPKNPAENQKLQVGLVGYPNVGKSSTINALIGSKKVSVSSTPGKTKHFQTIHLSEKVILCDCPGLVFPNFANTKADLVCNGVLPIDQMREHTGPVGLVTQRIPQRFLEAIYGIHIKTRPKEEGGTGIPTSSELLSAYAMARGFRTQGLGQPDESRASRYILKDYVSGKLLFVHPPPEITDAKAFNRELYTEFNLPEKRRTGHLIAAAESLDLNDDDVDDDEDDVSIDFDAHTTADADMVPMPMGPKSQRLDAGFFAANKSGGRLGMPFNHKYTEQGSAAAIASGAGPAEGSKMLTGRKMRTMVALENGMDPKDVQLNSKKHFKGGSKGNGKGKRRTGARGFEAS